MEKSNNVITCCLQCCVLYSASMISNAAHFHRSFRLLAQLCALLIAEILRLHSISVIMKPTIHNKITASFINQLLMFVMTAIRSEFKADHGISLSLKTLSIQLPSYKGITCSNMPVADVSRDPPWLLPTNTEEQRPLRTTTTGKRKLGLQQCGCQSHSVGLCTEKVQLSQSTVGPSRHQHHWSI